MAFVMIERTMKQIWVDSLLLLLVCIVLFAKVSTSYFCGYDDFGETHRAAFEDTDHPSHIFTTTHFGTNKYRPLNRLSTYLCWRIGGGSALPFRLRNLAFHLICALCVYGIALFWTRERAIALVAGLFFCLAPAANQNIVATVFTNTAAYAFLLSGFLVFLFWTEFKKSHLLAFSLFLELIGMFFYEPVIVVFPMMAGYLILMRIRHREGLSLKAVIPWLGGCAAVLFIFAFVRHFVVHAQNVRTPLSLVLHNSLLYVGGLLSPVDVVSANQLFGSALPPELHLNHFYLGLLALAVAVLAGGLFFFLKTPSGRAGMRRMDKGLLVYLALLIPMVLGPFLLFTPHASETYLYLPEALYSILLSTLLWSLVPSKTIYRLVVAAFLLCFGIGTWIRNDRVAVCGQTAREILQSLPTSRWHSAPSQIYLSTDPADTLPPRYGVYAYKGLSTIDPGDPDTGTGAQNALQVATGNADLKARVVFHDAMTRLCDPSVSCFDVSRNGAVHELALAPH